MVNGVFYENSKNAIVLNANEPKIVELQHR